MEKQEAQKLIFVEMEMTIHRFNMIADYEYVQISLMNKFEHNKFRTTIANYVMTSYIKYRNVKEIIIS